MKRAIALALLVLTVFALNHRSLHEYGKSLDSYHGRLVAWRVGLEVWWEKSRVVGTGTGTWWWEMPSHAKRFQELGSYEAWMNAHSLPVQLLFEHGLVGLALVGWLIWGHRRALRRSPVAWCVGILCLASFPLHVTQVALVAIVGVAITWRTHAEDTDRVVRGRLGARVRAWLASWRVGRLATGLRAGLSRSGFER